MQARTIALSNMRRFLQRRMLCTPAPPGTGPNHRSIMALDANTIRPFVQPNAHIAPDATVLGSVTVNDKSTVLSGAVLRGDLGYVQIGAYCVVGEGAAIVAAGNAADASPTDAVAAGLPLPPDMTVGDFSRVGAGVSLTSCYLEGENYIGDGAIVGDRVVIGRGARILPNSVVQNDEVVGVNEVWAGNPAKKVDTLSDVEVAEHTKNVENAYVTTARHAYEFLPIGTVYWEKEKLAKMNA